MMIFLSTVESVLEITSVEFVESGSVRREVVEEAKVAFALRRNIKRGIIVILEEQSDDRISGILSSRLLRDSRMTSLSRMTSSAFILSA